MERSKERHVPFSDKTAKTIHTFLIRHRKTIQGRFCFPPETARRLIIEGPKNLQNAGKRAGIYLHPHLVRHSSASQFIRMGGSPAVLQKVLGHSSLAITQRYVHLSNDDMHEAYERSSAQLHGCNLRMSPQN
ncbi:MAG: tyrosine-type recombinase/integrase [bacterium]|nr:tyrosine-type recombinase/integrase [bacterium]